MGARAGIEDVEPFVDAAAVVEFDAACTSRAWVGWVVDNLVGWGPFGVGWFAQLMGEEVGIHFEGRADRVAQPFHGYRHSV